MRLTETGVGATIVLLGAGVVGAGVIQTPQYLMDGRWARWNDDGSRIVFTLDTTYSNFNRHNVFTSDADGSNVTQITFFRGNEAFGQYGSAHGPSYRPGTGNVFWRDDRDGAWYQSWAADDGSTGRNRTTIAGHHTPIRFNPDGSRWTFAYNPGSGNHTVYIGNGEPSSGNYSSFITRPRISDVEWGSGVRSESLAITRRTSSIRNLYIIDSDGTDEIRLTDDAFGDVYNPVWAPDGESIYFVRDLAGQFDIWSIEIDSGALRQWTDDALRPQYPAVSPDGASLMYTVNFPDDSDVVNVHRLYTLDLTYVPGPATGSLLALGFFAATRRRRRVEGARS